MRYLTAVAVAVTIALAGLVLQVANMPGEAPKPIQVVPVDARQLAYEAATATAAHVLEANGCSDRYAPIIARAAIDHGLEPRIVAGVIVVESSCNPLAVSPVGAIGLMQINQRVWKHSRRELQDPEANIRIGTRILADYIRPRGVRAGLVRYNGLGTDCTYCDAGYTTHVLYAANRR
jgi:hypothetical protein